MADETLRLQTVTLMGRENGLSVEIVYADVSDVAMATESVVIRLPIQTFEYPRLAEARAEALIRVRDLLSAEIRAIEAAERAKNELKR
jgi:hypothetical protein